VIVLAATAWFVLGPWYAQTALHQDLRDPLNFTVWVCVGMGMFLGAAAEILADAIKEKK
jgi:hypothetical protein